MLQIDSLQHPVIRADNLTIAAGERVALAGSSGTGKSVFLQCLADLIPSQLTVSLDGVAHTDVKGHQWRQWLMYMPAEPAWWTKRVADHFPEQLRVPFSQLGLQEDLLERDPLRLSSGQRQRLALLRVLAREPRIMLLDEPTANLDEDNAQRVEAAIEKWCDKGGTVLFTSHDPRQRKRLGQRLWQIDDGAVQEHEW